jgi:hypothetical protein
MLVDVDLIDTSIPSKKRLVLTARESIILRYLRYIVIFISLRLIANRETHNIGIIYIRSIAILSLCMLFELMSYEIMEYQNSIDYDISPDTKYYSRFYYLRILLGILLGFEFITLIRKAKWMTPKYGQ